ncbi:MAG: DMT family transporter [Sphaerochaetaceae bacterium]|nr:DMT family transporter [Sphaerochaetaceae bacterium]
MNSQQLLGQLLALFTATCWAGNSVTYRYLGSFIRSDSLAHARMWIAFPAILLLTIFTDGSLPLHASARTYAALLSSGVIGYFITDLLMFKAYIFLGARESLVIMTLSPVVSAVLSYFCFSQALSVTEMSGITLTIGGIICMVLGEMAIHRKAPSASSEENGQNIKIGLACAFLGAILQSVSYILAKYALDDVPAVSSNLIRNFGGLIAFIVYSAFFSRHFFTDIKVLKNGKLFGLLALAAISGPVLGMSSQMFALTLAPVGIVTAISQISPILLLPVDKFVFHRTLSAASVTGTIISIAGVVLLFA